MRLKRAFDVVGSVGGLLFFAPVGVLIGLAILLEDGGPLLFRQPRLGQGRRRFDILKFRSMRGGQVTRVGRFIRATGLDELPQFVNILKGEMSAVGPRPLVDADVAHLGWATARHDFRWSVAPGLTGLAQMVCPGCARASLFLDRRYIERRSLWLDVRLVALSFAVNALGKRRVRALLLRQRRTGRDVRGRRSISQRPGAARLEMS